MATITSLGAGDSGADSRTTLNTNFTNLNTDKIETSVLDTDVNLTADSDAKIATQKAVKAYVDSGGGTADASTSVKGLVEEATESEVLAHTAEGGTGARLFVNPSTMYKAINWQLVTSASASGATAFTNLGAYNEIMVMFEEVTASSAVNRSVVVSDDNGSTYYTTSGDYEKGTSADTELPLSGGATGATNAWCIIHNFNVARYKPVTNSYQNGATVCKAVALNAVRCGGATLNGGTIYIYGR